MACIGDFAKHSNFENGHDGEAGLIHIVAEVGGQSKGFQKGCDGKCPAHGHNADPEEALVGYSQKPDENETAERSKGAGDVVGVVKRKALIGRHAVVGEMEIHEIERTFSHGETYEQKEAYAEDLETEAIIQRPNRGGLREASSGVSGIVDKRTGGKEIHDNARKREKRHDENGGQGA